MAKHEPLPRIDLNNEFLRCRVIGHAWDEVDGIFDRPPSFGVAYDLRCTRCGMIARDIISEWTGERLSSRRYVQPTGYAHKKDELPPRHLLKAIAYSRRHGG